MHGETRRSFVKKIGVASALAAGGFFNWNPRAVGANERVVLGLIGGRNQGRGWLLSPCQASRLGRWWPRLPGHSGVLVERGCRKVRGEDTNEPP